MLWWLEEVLGVKWVLGGRSPEEGFDCWGLVRWVLKNQLGAEVEDYVVPSDVLGRARLMVDSLARGEVWIEEEKPSFGSVAVMCSARYPHHVGVYLKDGYVLHVEEGSRVVAQKWNQVALTYPKITWYRHWSIKEK